jgi:hypothetical protein
MESTSSKKTTVFLALILASLACPSALFAQTITFDNLNTGALPGATFPFEAPIPNGYEGLQWNNMWVLDIPLDIQDGGSIAGSGYDKGLVSGSNVAFNAAGNPALISAGSFNLNSAYLTAAWNNGLQVEVQGFVGATLIYDNTYTVNPTGPALINFNYLDVDKVNFISSGGVNPGLAGHGTQFVMDNMNISAVPEPASLAFAGFGGLASLLAFRRWK